MFEFWKHTFYGEAYAWSPPPPDSRCTQAADATLCSATSIWLMKKPWPSTLAAQNIRQFVISCHGNAISLIQTNKDDWSTWQSAGSPTPIANCRNEMFTAGDEDGWNDFHMFVVNEKIALDLRIKILFTWYHYFWSPSTFRWVISLFEIFSKYLQ
jgi:hypothetical protein